MATGGGASSRLISPASSSSFRRVGQQVGRDAGQPVLQVGEPARALQQQLADDQQRPAIAHDVEARAIEQYWP